MFYCLTKKNLNYLAKQGLYIYIIKKEEKEGIRNKRKRVILVVIIQSHQFPHTLVHTLIYITSKLLLNL